MSEVPLYPVIREARGPILPHGLWQEFHTGDLEGFVASKFRA